MVVTFPTVNEVSIHIAFHNHPISPSDTTEILLERTGIANHPPINTFWGQFHKTVYGVNLSFEVRSAVSFYCIYELCSTK